jgi:predicted pyridoxine 5'-phosphate oxidase superfamily flavin-nucleotide-binding protein
MASLPEVVSKAWEDRRGPAIFTTVNKNGMPNAIYVGCVSKFSEDTIVVANNHFSKTQENILSGSKGSILFMSNKGGAYQIKGTIEYFTEGEIFDDMKKWNLSRPGHGAAAIRVEEVYAGAKKLL